MAAHFKSNPSPGLRQVCHVLVRSLLFVDPGEPSIETGAGKARSGDQMNCKVFSGRSRTTLEKRANDWLARQTSQFELHRFVTVLKGKGARTGVTVTVWYGWRHQEGLLAA